MAKSVPVPVALLDKTKVFYLKWFCWCYRYVWAMSDGSRKVSYVPC